MEDLERAAATLSTRTAPLVPARGVLAAAAGLLLKAEPSSYSLTGVFLGFAIVFAVVGLLFLTRAHFIYVGRRNVGLPPPSMTSVSRTTAPSASTPTRAAAAG